MVVVMMSKLHEVYVLAVASNDAGGGSVDVRPNPQIPPQWTDIFITP